MGTSERLSPTYVHANDAHVQNARSGALPGRQRVRGYRLLHLLWRERDGWLTRFLVAQGLRTDLL